MRDAMKNETAMPDGVPSLSFRLADENDTDTVNALYQSVKGTPLCTWDEDYPGLREICRDIETGNLYVLEQSGTVIGAISIAPERELDAFDGWRYRQNVGEFARAVIHPRFQGKHLAKVLVSNILAVMRDRGIEAVHLSVAKKNLPARKVYLGLGFQTVGEKEMWGNLYELCELKFPLRSCGNNTLHP